MWTASGTIERKVLWSMPPGDSMDMSKGYDDMISCATCSLSQRLMQKVLLPCFILVVSSCFNPHVCLIVGLWTCINSIDTFMYSYTLPILHFPYLFSSLCLSCNLSSSLRSLHLVKRQWAHLAREVYTNDTRQSYLSGNKTRVAEATKKEPRQVQEERTISRHYQND